MIKFDLHIHSKASNYKESNDIVDNSTKENIDVLLNNLNDHNVALFSITDHNRFNAQLYQKIDEILNKKEGEYKNVKNILAGVEFDVKLDESMNKCHIITIFNSKNKLENYKKIESAIKKDKLTRKDEFYNKKQFEDILYKIGLDTILIACQRKNIHNHEGGHNSLSDSTKKVEEIIRLGYINALEFQKPKVEGILKNNLKELPNSLSTSASLITGSDCHQWKCYPHHDCINTNKDFHHSKAKILPTFKGLLMAITSPKTRINFKENNNPVYFKGIKTKDKKVEFKNGINAIIGENGSGKSTLLKFINDELKNSYVKDIVNTNEFKKLNKIEKHILKYIRQGSIIDKFNNNKLFSSSTDEKFNDIDHSKFIGDYEAFSNKLKKIIKLRIKTSEVLKSLKNYSTGYNAELDMKNYYIHLLYKESFDNVANVHDEPLKKIKTLIGNLKKIKSDDYFNEYEEEINDIKNNVLNIFKQIIKKWKIIKSEKEIKNIIRSEILNYNHKINTESSTRDKEKKNHIENRQKVIDKIISAIELDNIKQPTISEPEIREGFSKNTTRGFFFNKEANYNNISMLNKFLAYMFNKEYQELEKVLKIEKTSDFIEAITNCTSEDDIENMWEENFNKFIKEATKEQKYITDGLDKNIGNTLGELSLAFYKYYTQDNDKWNIFIIDQPEDNISNKNISEHLIQYLNSIRYEKQIIMVTHNPMLVVNLDVDNVIYMENHNGDLTFKSGCLEYEDGDINILDLVANNMDGGRKSIEKRLRVYGKNN